jgi:hypothetical protein
MEANNEFIDLCSLSTHHIHKLFHSLKLTQDEPREAENLFHVNNIDGNWLSKANSPQYLEDVFSDMRFSEVILLLVTFLALLMLPLM